MSPSGPAALPGGTRCGVHPVRRGPGAPPLERLVRAALAGYGAALLGGVVAAQYVDAELFAYLTPFVVGVLTAAAAALAVLGVALGFALERSTDVLDRGALLPYAAALAGVVLWTLPPKARPQASSG